MGVLALVVTALVAGVMMPMQKERTLPTYSDAKTKEDRQALRAMLDSLPPEERVRNLELALRLLAHSRPKPSPSPDPFNVAPDFLPKEFAQAFESIHTRDADGKIRDATESDIAAPGIGFAEVTK